MYGTISMTMLKLLYFLVRTHRIPNAKLLHERAGIEIWFFIFLLERVK